MKESPEFYPLTFQPIPKTKVWGGTKLNTLLDKGFTGNRIGESWEISDVDDHLSVVDNGSMAGQTLRELINTYKGALIGEKIHAKFGDSFPLLIKFIDANENLSVQLHPDDEIAQQRHHSYGKTEMWYIVQADEGSNIIIDFNEQLTREQYLTHIREGKLAAILHSEKVRVGDAFIIHPGLVHAIGKGVMLAEIQQTSDITYRIYDWDRPDVDGKKRVLHTDLALEAIDFSKRREYKIDYPSLPNKPNPMERNQYFTTRYIQLTEPLDMDYSATESFVIFICVAGNCRINTGTNPTTVCLKQGETTLVPAACRQVTVHSRECTLLEVTI